MQIVPMRRRIKEAMFQDLVDCFVYGNKKFPTIFKYVYLHNFNRT